MSPFPLSGLADEAADDIVGQVAAQRTLGWPAIELRLLDGRQVCSAAVSDDAFARALDTIGEAGLRGGQPFAQGHAAQWQFAVWLTCPQRTALAVARLRGWINGHIFDFNRAFQYQLRSTTVEPFASNEVGNGIRNQIAQ